MPNNGNRPIRGYVNGPQTLMEQYEKRRRYTKADQLSEFWKCIDGYTNSVITDFLRKFRVSQLG